MISSEVLSLADKIHLVVQNCNEPGQSEEAEKTLLNLSRKLTAELESPFDVIRRIAFQVCLKRLFSTYTIDFLSAVHSPALTNVISFEVLQYFEGMTDINTNKAVRDNSA